jgi:alpha/beta superfamily hydrolase
MPVESADTDHRGGQSQDLRVAARIAQESTTATLPALIGFDFGLVLGFEICERIPWEVPQATIEDVDGISGLERRQAHGTIAQDLNRQLRP